MYLFFNRRILLFLLLFSFLNRAKAQEVQVTVHVLDTRGQALAGAMVAFLETASGQKLSVKADGAGVASFRISGGRSWMLHVNDHPYRQDLVEPGDDYSYKTQEFTVTHNPALLDRLRNQVFNRKGYQLKVQDLNERSRPAAGHCLVGVTVIGGGAQTGRSYNVSLAQVKDAILYRAKTNASGLAIFMVPAGKNYDIDVEELMNASHLDLDREDGLLITTTVDYDPPPYQEKERNDTITQQLPPGMTTLHGRTHATVIMNRNDGRSIKGQPVWLRDLSHGKVYSARTDEEGKVIFALPFERKYLVSFQYEPDVELINLMETRGQSTVRFELTYRPLPELEFPERFLPGPDEVKLFEPRKYMEQVRPGLPGTLYGYTIPLANKEMLFRYQLTLPKPRATPLPLDIVFLLDKSGSMESDSNFIQLKEVLKASIARLGVKDRCAVIFYDSDKSVLSPLIYRPNDLSSLYAAIDRQQTGGSTNIASAFEAAIGMLSENKTQDRNAAMVIVSDGYDEQSADDLAQMRSRFKSKAACFTVGVGAVYNKDFLQQLSDNSGGIHYGVGDRLAFDPVLQKVFNEAIQAPLENVIIGLKWPKDRLPMKLPYGREAMVQGNTATIKTDRVASGSTITGMLKLQGPATANELPKANLSFILPETSGRTLHEDQPAVKMLAGEEAMVDEYMSNRVNDRLRRFAIACKEKKMVNAAALLREAFGAMKEWGTLHPAIKNDAEYKEISAAMQLYERALTGKRQS